MYRSLSFDWYTIKYPCFAIHSKIDKNVPISHLYHLNSTISNIKTLSTYCAAHYIWWGNGSKKVIEMSFDFLNTHKL